MDQTKQTTMNTIMYDLFEVKKFRFASNEDADPFYFKKNSDLHLGKM